MRRGAKPAKARGGARLPVAPKSPKDEGATVRDLEKRLAEALQREAGAVKREAETQEQQTATAEILPVISASPSDVSPVFRAIVRSATRLCDATFGTVFRFDGELITVAANQDLTPEEIAITNTVFPAPATRGIAAGRAIVDRAVVHISDIRNDPDYVAKAPVSALGYRTALAVPLLKEGSPIGVFVMWRREVRPFTDEQIELVRTFADQAVIAIENVRLFTELQQKNEALSKAHSEVSESLEQQTATSDILRVISQSPTDVQPTFEAIARSARRLCEAAHGMVFRFDGALIHLTAHDNLEPEQLEAVRSVFPIRPGHESVTARAILTRSIVHVRDRSEDPELEYGILSANFPTTLSVPLLRDGVPLGAITVTRGEVRLFSDKQVELLKTFADQAVIAIENVRLFRELEARNRELTTALDQQTATSDILRAISASPVDVQPVFEAIARNSVRLCNGVMGAVFRFDGEFMHIGALHGFSADGEVATQRAFPARPERRMLAGRAVLSRAIVHVPDVMADPEFDYRTLSTTADWRSLLVVPMLRGGEVLGTVGVARAQIGPFRDQEIGLLQTFADQAVIAIENVRLFKELQEKNRALSEANAQVTESLEQQTATAEILRVISSSPTDMQPVFDSIAESAVRLCGAEASTVTRFDGEWVHLVAVYGSSPEGVDAVRRAYPVREGGASAAARSIRDRAIAHIPDVLIDEEYGIPEAAVASRFRAALAVPMLHEGRAIGAIAIGRREPGEFNERQVELLRTFADQAVIAVENVRLFKELEARNRDLTATSEVLQVISRSPTDVQPVFDTIARNARRLCNADSGGVLRLDGGLLHLQAFDNASGEGAEAMRRAYPSPVSSGTGSGRAILTGRAVQIPDVLEDPEYELAGLQGAGLRSVLSVPMLLHGTAIGVISVHTWATPRPFTDQQMELLKTFADQAVIAVENVRLFKELEARTNELTQSVEKLTALGEVSRAVSSTLDVETVLNTIVSRASQLAGAAGCSIFEYDEASEQFELRATHNYDTELVEALRAVPLRKGEGLMGRAAEMREPVQVPDITQPGAYESSVRDTLIRFGYRALLAVPLLREDQIIGSLSFNRKEAGEFPPEVIEVLKTFATQSALAIQNARLFHEIADTSAQLEAASRHKSEFLANMSHELRTPLNAIIGFSEVLSERLFGELNEKQDEYMKDIHASGQHLLSLINDILDLSKIEAGRMELELTDFDLPTAIDNALTLVRERAGRRGIALHLAVDERLGQMRADERKVRQVVLNLLSNAIKFTPEGGRIEVAAVPRHEFVEVSVSDTGIGIAPEDQEAVFEEFRQVGTAAKKVEGTGLGLALSRRFIELHGGRIWLESRVGIGSTFTFSIPVLRADQVIE
jgi:GAF domain-containing protein